jgi:hypothetical protein
MDQGSFRVRSLLKRQFLLGAHPVRGMDLKPRNDYATDDQLLERSWLGS